MDQNFGTNLAHIGKSDAKAFCCIVCCCTLLNRLFKCASTVDMLKGILKDDSNMNSAKQHLALLCLGGIGRRKDLSIHVHIKNIVIESFQSPFEEINLQLLMPVETLL